MHQVVARSGRSAAVRCADDGAVVASYRGLFGDAWLSCSVEPAGPDDGLVERTGRWCVTVLQAASA